MEFVQNLPFISILVSLFAGPVCLLLKGKKAKYVNLFVIISVGIMQLFVLLHALKLKEAYTYSMGHYPAPWGNEIRIGILEASMALFFTIILLLSMLAGIREREKDIDSEKQNLYYVMTNLLLCSLMALVYTNDIFNAYVFVEINTIAACGLIMIREKGRTVLAATRYMIMNLLGSGLFLLGICFLYDLTGHLLMSNIKEQVAILNVTGEYHMPLLVAIVLLAVGLAIKSALYPFHSWVPDAYGYSTVSSAAILSSLVSKGYIFLLIKIFYRVVGFDIIASSKVIDVLFVFGVAGMLMGSVNAIKEKDIRRMIAFSSVAQIGYIYMGFGLGTVAGMVASVYRIVFHAATKSLLFVAASGLIDASGNDKHITSLKGAGYRNKTAGVAFTVGALSMIGFPLLSGFISKILFAGAAWETDTKMIVTLVALAISTILNAMYFMRTVITIYTPMKTPEVKERGYSKIKFSEETLKNITLIGFIVLNVLLGVCSEPVVDLIEKGLAMFG